MCEEDQQELEKVCVPGKEEARTLKNLAGGVHKGRGQR